MWLGTYNIDELLTFKINTHDTSSVSTNADSAPNYRIYEEMVQLLILQMMMEI